MNGQYTIVVGSWVDAVGTILSLIAEIREQVGMNEINNLLIAIGEALQASGGSIVGTVPVEDPLNFSGLWIDNIGAGTSSLSAYLQYLDNENTDDLLQLEVLGDGLQSMGSAMSAVSQYEAGEFSYALGDSLQSLGAGLETIADLFELRKPEINIQPVATLGALFQAVGTNLLAILSTKELRDLQ